MEGLFVVIAIGWVIFNLIGKGLKAANQSQKRPDQSPPQGARPRTYPPLTPTARPGGNGVPAWDDIMTMLGGGTTPPPQQAIDMEGESTEALGPSGSLIGPSMMEGSPSMLEGPGMMEGSAPMMGANQSGYEGRPLPGDAPVAAPTPEIPVAPPLKSAARPKRYDPAAMRDAVVWAEILAKPKSLRRVAR